VPFAQRIRELSAALTTCRDDAQSLKLAQELQALLHARIEQLREKVDALRLLPRSQKPR
jgi:hypothetical protein